MGLRKLKEYHKPPQMRVLRQETDKKTNFPAWMIIVLMIAVVGSFVISAENTNDDETLEEFAERAVKEQPKKLEKKPMGKVTESERQLIGVLIGKNVKGFNWTIDNYNIRHILNKKAHGIKLSDIKYLYGVIHSADRITKAESKKDVFIVGLTKTYGNKKITVFAEIRTGKKEIIVLTMYKNSLK